MSKVIFITGASKGFKAKRNLNIKTLITEFQIKLN